MLQIHTIKTEQKQTKPNKVYNIKKDKIRQKVIGKKTIKSKQKMSILKLPGHDQKTYY